MNIVDDKQVCILRVVGWSEVEDEAYGTTSLPFIIICLFVERIAMSLNSRKKAPQPQYRNPKSP